MADIPVGWEAVARLTAATAVGFALGVNREIRGKPAGIRTHALVSLASAIIIQVTLHLASDDGVLEQTSASRAIQGILAGIGFVGGGVILKDPTHRHVEGLTTAVSIWMAAALGIVCGAGEWLIGGAALGLTLLVLTFSEPIENLIRRKFPVPPAEPPVNPPGAKTPAG